MTRPQAPWDLPDLSPAPSRARLWVEIAIVLALGLGQSAVYAIVQLAYRLTDEVPLAEQVAKLNPSRSDREVFDLIYQVLAIGFSLVPVVLVCFLLWQSRRPHLARLGLDGTGVAKDAGRGVPPRSWRSASPASASTSPAGLSGSRSRSTPAGIDAYWWTVPVLQLAAARASLQEEFVLLGYLFTRLRQLGWSPWTIIVSTSVLRASYHLYQGVSGVHRQPRDGPCSSMAVSAVGPADAVPRGALRHRRRRVRGVPVGGGHLARAVRVARLISSG